MTKKKASKKSERIRLHPLGTTDGGDTCVMEICKEGQPADEPPEIAYCTKVKSGVAGPIGGQIGQFHHMDDGHIEFEPIDTAPAKIAFEDRSKETSNMTHSGPSRVNSPAFREGWARVFEKN